MPITHGPVTGEKLPFDTARLNTISLRFVNQFSAYSKISDFAVRGPNEADSASKSSPAPLRDSHHSAREGGSFAIFVTAGDVAALAESDRGILRSLIGVKDCGVGPARSR